MGSVLERTDVRIPGIDIPLMSVSQTRGVVRRSELTDKPPRAESLDAYKVCRHGDIVFNKMSVRAGALGLAPEDGLVTYHYEVMRIRDPRQADGRFLVYLMKSDWFIGELIARERGIGAGDSTASVRTTEVPFKVLRTIDAYLPDAQNQRLIADYLDRETAQIDTLIAKQTHLVSALRDRRREGIRSLVTRGLDPSAEFRANPLPWADAIPAHWHALNIRRVAAMKTGHTPSRSNPEYWENTIIPWFTLADVWQLRDESQTYLGDTANTISELGLANSAAELLPAGTVVLSRTASVGFTGVMPQPMATSQDFWNWVCGPRLLPEYLMYVFRAMRPHLLSLMIGSTHKTIYQPIAAAIRIPLPPVDEQKTIVAEIERQTAKIDALIAKAQQFIALAKERRAALITAAVTGRIDVTTGKTRAA
ncbi:restriction endonuclease subunit S [Microbacterium sp. Root53]|uniref:restriction endonuclease subunit S n=1 Tax=Microbacterium sp. Root53 TaxID=1736553 RepID=UPI001F2995E9|nr:restriction endonuclease subunit S [Microbacterium sp. Root53]